MGGRTVLDCLRGPLRVGMTRTRAATFGHRTANVGFPAVSSRSLPSQPDPQESSDVLFSLPQSRRVDLQVKSSWRHRRMADLVRSTEGRRDATHRLGRFGAPSASQSCRPSARGLKVAYQYVTSEAAVRRKATTQVPSPDTSCRGKASCQSLPSVATGGSNLQCRLTRGCRDPGRLPALGRAGSGGTMFSPPSPPG
jgi:hypothetical protein